MHRSKCEQHRAAVEKALSELVGSTVTIELLDGGSGGNDDGDRSPAPEQTLAASDDAGRVGDASSSATPVYSTGAFDEAGDATVTHVLPDDDDVDLDDLIDAPPESVKTPIDRLAEAFPGSELIEEAG